MTDDMRYASARPDVVTYQTGILGKDVTLESVSIDGKEVRNVHAAVIEGLDVSLLGQTYLSRITAVQMSGDTMTLR